MYTLKYSDYGRLRVVQSDSISDLELALHRAKLFGGIGKWLILSPDGTIIMWGEVTMEDQPTVGPDGRL